jgi:hypothetical protein
MELRSAPPFFSRSTVKLSELDVFGWKYLEQSWFFGFGVAWSCTKHALVLDHGGLAYPVRGKPQPPSRKKDYDLLPPLGHHRTAPSGHHHTRRLSLSIHHLLFALPFQSIASSSDCLPKSNSIRWSKFHPLYEVIGGGVKIFSSLKHNLLQQFPYFPSQLVGLTMPHHLLLYKVSGSHW